MGQQKSIFGTVKQIIFNYIESLIVGTLKEKIRGYLHAFFRMLSLLAITLMFFLIGFIYITLGIIKVLSIVIPEWASLIVVGLILSAMGYLTFRELNKKLE